MSSQFLSKTIVVPNPTSTNAQQSGPSVTSLSPAMQADGGLTRRERRSRATSASSGLHDEAKKRGWAPFRRVKRFFSRGDGLDQARRGDLEDHAFTQSHGNAVKYTPGPDSLYAGGNRHAHSRSEPIPMTADDLARASSGNPAARAGPLNDDVITVQRPPHSGYAMGGRTQVQTKAEATSNTKTDESRKNDAPQQHTTTMFKSVERTQGRDRNASMTTDEKLGDDPVRLTVKLITKLKDRNEDPTVNSREVVVRQGKSGFGLTLAGSSPVIVIHILPNGPADRAGVLVGDMIVAVTDIDVRRSTQAHVSKMMALASRSPQHLLTQGNTMDDLAWERIKTLQEQLERNEPITGAIGAAPMGQAPLSASVGETSATNGTQVQARARSDTTGLDARRSHRVSLDLTSDAEIAGVLGGTPDSFKSRSSGANALSSCTSASSSNPPSRKSSAEDQLQEQQQTHSPAAVEDKPRTSVSSQEQPPSRGGLNVLIRQQSRKIRAQRVSSTIPDESHTLPIAMETEEDERIVDMINNRHSLLLTEAVERCHRDRLDDKETDGYLSEEESRDTSGTATPYSGLSTPGSDERALDSKSAPTTPNTRKRVKVRRSESHKGGAVIVKQKSGRVLVAARPRPTILPGDVAARLVEGEKVSPHVDSGYMSLHQDDIDTEQLEQALVNANVRLAGSTQDSPGAGEQSANSTPDSVAKMSAKNQSPVTLHVTKITPPATGQPPAENGGQTVTPRNTGKPQMRRVKSMLVPGTSSSLGRHQPPLETGSEPQWKLDLRRQREESERGQADVLGALPNMDAASKTQTLGARPLQRLNSARMIASAAKKKDSDSKIAREERPQPVAGAAGPSWVAMAKDKSRRASLHGKPATADLPSPQASPMASKPGVQSRRSTGSVEQPNPTSALQQLTKARSSSSMSRSGMHRTNKHEEQPPQQRRSIVITEQEVCIVCSKTVYHSERHSAEGLVFHMACVRCSTCQRKLHLDKFVIVKKRIYCKQHSMEMSMKLAPSLAVGPMPSMSARGGALPMGS